MPPPSPSMTLISALTSPTSNRLYVEKIIHTLSIPEYPETRIAGVCYVISTATLLQEAYDQPWNEVIF